MTVDYIILRDSVEQAEYVSAQLPKPFKGKKFPVIVEGFDVRDEKSEEVERAIDGTADYTPAPITGRRAMVLRTKDQLEPTEDIHFGTMADLQRLHRLNNPNASPNNLITLVDHYGQEHHGYLVGARSPKALTTVIEGQHAHFLVPIQFVEKEPLV